LAGLGEGGDLVNQRFIELDSAAGVDVNLGHGLAVELADVSGHLEGGALALVVNRSLLHILVGNRVGFDGIKLEFGLGGVEVGRRLVKTAQNLIFIFGSGGSSQGGAVREQ